MKSKDTLNTTPLFNLSNIIGYYIISRNTTIIEFNYPTKPSTLVINLPLFSIC